MSSFINSRSALFFLQPSSQGLRGKKKDRKVIFTPSQPFQTSPLYIVANYRPIQTSSFLVNCSILTGRLIWYTASYLNITIISFRFQVEQKLFDAGFSFFIQYKQCISRHVCTYFKTSRYLICKIVCGTIE